LKYRDFKGDNISLLGFGLMRLPIIGEDKKKIDYEKAGKMIDRAIEAGVNYFDTAHPYHGGESEKFAGEALSKYPRESYYLATKMPSWIVKDEAQVEEIFNGQLEKCKTDYFDFYLVHDYHSECTEVCEKFGLYDILKRKKEEGKIRHLGLSVHDTYEGMKKTLALHEWDFVQLQLNYLDWDMIDMEKQYRLARDMGLPVIVMEPVRGGTLARLEGDAGRMLKEAEPEMSLASWAMRFVMSLPNIVTILSGMSDMEQLEDNIKTIDTEKTFGEGERKLVMEAARSFLTNGTIPCTGCNYCMDCPAGVDIPKMFAIYNEFCVRKSRVVYEAAYYNIGDGKQAYYCVACGACESLCPQNIKISENMKMIAGTIEG